MRIANQDGRLVIITDAGSIDVESASGGAFSADPQAVYARWDEFRAWAAHTDLLSRQHPAEDGLLLTPVPRPTQVLAIGLNYRDHAAESGMSEPKEPMVFTKFASCLTGPFAEVAIAADSMTDWEIELVVVIGARAENVTVDHAWDHVAGLTVGQDISDRLLQFRDPTPQQFNLGKSLPGFGPVGPAVVTPDEFPDPDDLVLTCTVDGELMQKASTKDMIFSVPQLISRLSQLLPLLPGDLVFTGTPAGIGVTRTPPRFLTPGQTLTSHIEGIGELRNPIIAAPARYLTSATTTPHQKFTRKNPL